MKRASAAIGTVIALALTMLPGGLSMASAAGPSGSCPITLPQGSDPVTLDPADFGGPIDNRYWPMAPGTKWVFKEGAAKVRITVKQRTRMIQGIEATVVHDVVSERRELVEDTIDWYAQDVCGNVWYLGEKTAEYKNGQVVTTAGSWEAGVDGAQAGIAMPADPTVGTTYRQEYYAGEAEDAATVLSTDERVEVPYGRFRNALLTKDFTPLHPRILEYKLYAKGVGPVLVLGVSGGSIHEQLVRFTASTG